MDPDTAALKAATPLVAQGLGVRGLEMKARRSLLHGCTSIRLDQSPSLGLWLDFGCYLGKGGNLRATQLQNRAPESLRVLGY